MAINKKPVEAAYSLMEILIVVGVLVIVAAGVLALLNPKKQIEKGFDAKRKTELTILSKKLEDWYNDKNCYPEPDEICYDGTSDTQSGTKTCHICGKESGSPPDLLNHIDRLPCDPEHPTYSYTYETEGGTCPGWYRVYSKLGIEDDSVITELGCTTGCGPAPYYAFDFGVSSPNINLEMNPAQTTPTPTSGAGPTSPPGATATPTPTTDPGFFPTLTPTPTTVPGATATPTPVQGACISQSTWSNCTAYCQSIGKSCFSAENLFTYQGYADINCQSNSTEGCKSGGGGCCNSWPFLYTRVICYCN